MGKARRMQPEKQGKGRGNRESKNLSTERAGQFALFSKLLTLGYNFSVPEIDWGVDVIVFDSNMEEYRKIQVKSTRSSRESKSRRGHGHYKKYTISVQANRIDNASHSNVFYVIVLLSSTDESVFLVFTAGQLKHAIKQVKKSPTGINGIGPRYSINIYKYLESPFKVMIEDQVEVTDRRDAFDVLGLNRG
jgi:hypothetical protein